MTDSEDRTLDRLFENLKQLREHMEDGFSDLRKDNRSTNERIAKLSHAFHEDQNRIVNRLDLVAAQVVKVGDEVEEVKQIVSERSDEFEQIERRLDGERDRLDDHQERIEVLQHKTAHLPTPLPK